MPSSKLPLALLASSFTVQSFATAVALRFAARGRHRLPWMVMAGGLAVMALRRGLQLWSQLAGTPSAGADELVEQALAS